jgi:glyoxylase I family protein
MKFEHFALNVPDARAMARWYAAHIGFKVLRSREDNPYTQFLGDDTGRVCLEIYSNASAVFPDYAAQHPLLFHFAVFAPDARAQRDRLVQAGATPFSEETMPDGTVLIFVRDPWGVPLQLCQRAQPFPGF